ncbi:SsrA-binding protein SmpB [Pigmentiphaga soli]|uniref:SsrA-binding protein n=1 Tax=Pigmentiphaga soli TaxID=1007095 RepID=A0ABP8HEE8_9BURK
MSIIDNRKAFHDYFIDERFEAGLVLEGWEVKAIRAGRVQLKESYVIVRNGELWLLGMHVSPLETASTHIHPDATRTRKLLLKAEEISKLIGKVEQRGFTLIPLNLHYKGSRIKLEFGLARGKKLYDKRDTERERDWLREKAQIMKHDTRQRG